MAFVSIPRSELRSLAKLGNKDAHAHALLTLRENPERTLSIIQIGITLVGAVAAAIGGAGASETLEPYFIRTFSMHERTAEALSIFLVVLPITYFSVVVGILHAKEFIALKETGETNWPQIIRSALYVQPTDSALG